MELERSLDWPLWAGQRLPPAVGIAVLADRWSSRSLLKRSGHCQAVGLYMAGGRQSLGSGAPGEDTGVTQGSGGCHADLKETKEQLQQNGENGENLAPTCVCRLDFVQNNTSQLLPVFPENKVLPWDCWMC